MKRRELIKKLAWSVPAGFMLPSISGCTPTEKATVTDDTSVVVIGAGVAGLHCAFRLSQMGLKPIILEADDRHGGRIRRFKQQGFADFPLEFGADEVYGNDNSWYNMITGTGVELIDTSANNVYVLDGVKGVAADFETDTDFQLAHGFVDQIANYQGSDVSVKDAIGAAGLDERTHHILEGEIGHRYGSSNGRVGMRGISRQRSLISDGSGIFLSDRQPLINVVNSVYNTLIPNIQYNSPVTGVDYSGDKVLVTVAGAEALEVDKVVLAVPLSILKDGDIEFSPSMPGTKLSAVNNLGMDSAIRIALAFNGTFWGSNTRSVISDGTFTRYFVPGLGRSENNNILTVLATGEQAENLSALENTEIFQLMLDDLDRLYNGNASRLVRRDMNGVIDGVLFDWGKEPFIRGAYSYPKVGASLSRITLAVPIESRIFFAGEAVSLNNNFGTVQGAIDSAERVATEIEEALAKERANEA